MANAPHPAHQFRKVEEANASDFLQAMVGTEEGAKAAGRVALAFRQAAQTNDRLYGCDPVSVAQAVARSTVQRPTQDAMSLKILSQQGSQAAVKFRFPTLSV